MTNQVDRMTNEKLADLCNNGASGDIRYSAASELLRRRLASDHRAARFAR